MASVLERTLQARARALTSDLRRPAVLVVSLAILAVLALYAETVASIVGIWARSDTFAHGFVVVPLALWLTWQRRAALQALTAQPWLPGVAAVLVFGAAWLIATLADVQSGRQFALLFMLEAAIVAVVGLRIAREIAFPLVFLLFAVPFGEFMVPTLIDWTANFTVAALRASGVPVYREANHFIIPSGAWSVVEACSGIRYLIVSVVVGTVYAAVTYRSTRYRVMFILASILVPLVANWLRAYGIVMLGHLSGNTIAVGVDHLIYGWLFFGVVMLVLFWIGARWRESLPDGAPAPAQPQTRTALATSPRRIVAVAALAVVAAIGWPPLAVLIDRNVSIGPVTLEPLTADAGWAPTTLPFATWKPHYTGAAAELQQAFRSARGDHAGLYVAFYRNQVKGRELVTSVHGLVERSDWRWRQVATARETIDWSGRSHVAVRGVIAGESTRLIVYKLYWIDERVTASDFVAKALLAWSRLQGRGDDAALVVFYSPAAPDDNSAQDSLRAFITIMSPQVERMLGSAKNAVMP